MTIKLISEYGEIMDLEPRLVPCRHGDVLLDANMRIIYWLAHEPKDLTPERAAEVVSKATGEQWRVSQLQKA